MSGRMSFLSSRVALIIAEWNCVVVTPLQTKTSELMTVVLFETDFGKLTFDPVMVFSVQHVCNNLLRCIFFQQQNGW